MPINIYIKQDLGLGDVINISDLKGKGSFS